jgi:SAM-dependent methyltransferase
MSFSKINVLRIPQAEGALACSTCHGVLTASETAYACNGCGASYRVEDNRIFFEQYTAEDRTDHPDGLIYRLKRYMKVHYPGFFFLIYRLVSVRVAPSISTLAKTLPPHALMINIGAGAKPVDPALLNIDLVPEPGVDLIANAYRLPLRPASIDLLVAESLLEHLEDPAAAVKEMRRVLKPGGLLYIVTPFMVGFHSSPSDFYRWTIPGMELLLEGFQVTRAGVEIGPTGTLTMALREWLGVLLSFNSRTLYQLWVLFFMILFIPLNAFDWLLARYNSATQIATSYYFIARKK